MTSSGDLGRMAAVRVRVAAAMAVLAALARGPAAWRELAAMAVAALGRVLAPDRCAACDAPPACGEVLCAACAASVVPAVESAEVVACAAYSGAMAIAVKRFKYGGRPDLAGPLGRLLRAAARGTAADVVAPVPLHPRKLRARGYNQAALLAGAAAAAIGAPIEARLLVRTRDTAAQARLDGEARRTNLAGAFRVRVPERVRGRRVLLVDDVYTTGATLEECRAALLGAGAASVQALVLARGGRGGGEREGEIALAAPLRPGDA